MSAEIKEVMNFPWEFTSPIEIEETVEDRTMISGTLLVEGTSRNGNLYTIDEMENIANSSVGVPIKFGVGIEIDPNSGTLKKNSHIKDEDAVVGKIVKTLLIPKERRIKYWALITNTVMHPNIAETVKKGWGVSIGGWAKFGKWVVDKVGNLLMKIIGLKVNHVQLLPPDVKRGQEAAKVEEVGEDARFVQESFIESIARPTKQEIVKAVISQAIRINLTIED